MKSIKTQLFRRSRLPVLIAGALVLLTAGPSLAAISLDRTRIIYNGGDKAMSVSIANQNKTLPYLAQGWLEDDKGKKITSPLAVLPPVQRLEAGAKSQIKIQGMESALLALPQDRESLFYFNLREIPPKSKKANVLQIALQTRVKVFYRPADIVPDQKALANPWQKQLTLTRHGDRFTVNNPTPYYVTISDALSHKGGKTVVGFQPIMVPPKGSMQLPGSADVLGSAPVLTYINDYGGRPQITFRCEGGICTVTSQNDTVE